MQLLTVLFENIFSYGLACKQAAFLTKEGTF